MRFASVIHNENWVTHKLSQKCEKNVNLFSLHLCCSRMEFKIFFIILYNDDDVYVVGVGGNNGKAYIL